MVAPMPKATWHGVTLAEAPTIQRIDGYPYFAPEAVNWAHLREATQTSECGWKGTANYYDVVAGDQVNGGAAWVYRTPKADASHIAGHIAFWKGVVVE